MHKGLNCLLAFETVGYLSKNPGGGGGEVEYLLLDNFVDEDFQNCFVVLPRKACSCPSLCSAVLGPRTISTNKKSILTFC